MIVSGPDGNPVAEQGNAIYYLEKQPRVGWTFLIDAYQTDGDNLSSTPLEAEQMTTQAQVQEQNKALARRIFAEGDKNNLEFLDEVCTSDYKFYFPSNAMPISADEHKELWQSFNLAFPDLTHTVREIYADGEVVVARLVLTGTHEGEFAGMPPTGREVEFSAMEIFRFSEGKLAELWSDGDILSLQQQLGMELKPREREND
jgi:predicted ester cyclase